MTPFDDAHGCWTAGVNGRAEHRGDPLTVDQIRGLEPGTEVVVTWAGGNGPHLYRVVEVNSEVCVDNASCDVLLTFGTEQRRPLNRVTRA